MWLCTEWTLLKTPKNNSYKVTCPIPNQSAKSFAFANAVDSPMTRQVFVVWLEIKFVRETITSKTGPRSSPNKWISSITNSATSFTYFRVCQLRLTPSHFSGVVTMTSALTIASMSGVASPVNSMTLWLTRKSEYCGH